MIFVDTSAFLSVLDADDINHQKAKDQWQNLIANEKILISSNYVIVETFAIVQHRLGIDAVRVFQDDVVPILNVEWIDENDHQSGIVGVFAAARKRLSLVDCISFTLMRKLGIRKVFTLDKHFKEQGFECIP